MSYFLILPDKAIGPFKRYGINANDYFDSTTALGYAKQCLNLPSPDAFQILSDRLAQNDPEAMQLPIEAPLVRIVRVDGSIIWRDKAAIAKWLEADAIYFSPHDNAYIAKL